MKFESYWHDSSRPFSTAEAGEVTGSFDVAVIGAGFTGLAAARKLAKSGLKVAVLEAHHVAFGASGRNGGHMNSGMAESFGAAAAHLGEDRARRLWQAFNDSIDLIEQIVSEENIECNFRRSGKLKLASKPSHVARIKGMGEEIARTVDSSVRWLDRDALKDEIGSDRFYGGVLYPKSGMAHMGNYAVGLAEASARHGAFIWEQAPVTSQTRKNGQWTLVTPKGALSARNVILATDAYTTKNFPYLKQRIIPIASFIVATRPLSPEEVAATLPGDRNYVNSLNIANYFRLTPDRRILFGGRAQFSSDSNPVTDAKSGALLRRQLLGMLPQLESVALDYCWGGLVGCSRDRYPRIGCADNMHFAAGYSGHGAQFSTLAGSILADKVMGLEGTNPLEGMSWPAIPLYSGKPWFMPVIGAYYRLKDMMP